MTEQKNGKSKAEGKQKDNLLGLPVLLCVLKGITSEDAALSAAELTREMREVTGEEYSVKTVGRHLEKTVVLGTEPVVAFGVFRDAIETS